MAYFFPLIINRAWSSLCHKCPHHCRIFECRTFSGFTIDFSTQCVLPRLTFYVRRTIRKGRVSKSHSLIYPQAPTPPQINLINDWNINVDFPESRPHHIFPLINRARIGWFFLQFDTFKCILTEVIFLQASGTSCQSWCSSWPVSELWSYSKVVFRIFDINAMATIMRDKRSTI